MKNTYEIRGDITAIFVYTKGKYVETLISTVDLNRVDSMEGTWSYMKDSNGREYIKNYKYGYLHKWIVAGEEVDHVNHNSLDNRRENLVPTDHEGNMQNTKIRKDNKSGIAGVTKHKHSNKWRARIRHRGVEKALGTHDTKYEAGRAVNRYRVDNGIKPVRKAIKIEMEG